jgi:hypothetical protein
VIPADVNLPSGISDAGYRIYAGIASGAKSSLRVHWCSLVVR